MATMMMTRVYRDITMTATMMTNPAGHVMMTMTAAPTTPAPTTPTMMTTIGGDADPMATTTSGDEIETGDDDARMRWTPPPMTQKAVYKKVGETVGLQPKKVKEVAEAMMAVAAKQLKSAGSFKIAGALNLKLKVRLNMSLTKEIVSVRGSPLKKFKEMVNYPCLIAD